MHEQLFIGVDGGGSGSRAVIATANRVLGHGRGGPANVSSDGAGAITSVLAALDQARHAAGLADLSGAIGHLGLAGVLTADHAKTVAAAMPFPSAAVTDDRPTTLAGALGDADGIVAAIGTGSFIGAKRGTAFRFIGGWGLVLGDEASAAWLGRAGLAQTLMAQDGLREKTGLTHDIMTHFNDDPNAIVAFAATATPSAFGRFAPRISAAAQEADTLGLDLMRQGANYIDLGMAALKPRDGDVFCLTGGLGPSYARYLPPAVQAKLRPAIGSALDGALRLARRMG